MRQWIQGLFDSEARERRSFEKLATKVVSKNQQHEDRMIALETLADMDSPEALSALFRRWDMTSEKAREDRAEKEYLADVLVAKGPAMFEALRAHNDRSPNVTWPIEVLRRVTTEEEVVTEIIRVLEHERGKLASFKPEKKVTLLRLLQDQDDARITDAAVPFLKDFDESVRYEAAELLGIKGTEDALAPLVDRLSHPDEDSARVRGGILGALARQGWALGDRAATVSKHLAPGFAVQDGVVVES